MFISVKDPKIQRNTIHLFIIKLISNATSINSDFYTHDTGSSLYGFRILDALLTFKAIPNM